MVTTVGAASAAFTGPFHDTWVQQNGVNNAAATGINVQDSTAACTDTQIGYFQFDVSNIGKVNSAILELTHAPTAIGIATNTTALTLYGVPDFDPATLDGSNDPLPSPLPDPLPAGVQVIQTKTFATVPRLDTKLRFGDTDAYLAQYIQSQANRDGVVTLALSFSAGCNGNNSQLIFFSQDYSANAARRPQLTVEFSNPTGVDMRTAAAQQPASWPLYAGLAAVALFVVAGVVISRRRTA